MRGSRKLFVAKLAVGLGAVPFVVWALEYGPDAGYSGVPGENGTCATAGCHLGTANNPANQGAVTVSFPNGTTYTPGVTQRLVVTIADPAPTQRAWGFELTARSAANPSLMAGTLASADANTALMCAVSTLFSEQQVDFKAGGGQVCPSSMPLQYMEHSLAGYSASRGHTGSQTYEMDWTPPSANVGDVTIYVAGNAANGDLTPNGDHIYTRTYTLTPASAGTGAVPAIAAVINGASFQPGIESGSWVTITGSNLANTNPGRTWRVDEIVNGNLPTSLDGVSVTINGKPAFVYYISPVQINVQAPSDAALGPVNVVVTNNGAQSAPATAQLQPFSPACFQYSGTNYAIVTRFPDNALIANPAVVPGAVAAKPGDILILWATGFGSTNPEAPAGKVVTGAPAATTTPLVTVGGAGVSVIGVALSPGSVGLYQVAIQLPASVPTGVQALQASVGGFQSPGAANIFVASQ